MAVAVGPEPHGVTVYRRSSAGNQSKVDIERITFEGTKSSKILDVADRPVNRSSAMMRGGPRPSGNVPMETPVRQPKPSEQQEPSPAPAPSEEEESD